MRRFLAVGLFVALVLGACANDGEPSEGDGGGNETPTTQEQAPGGDIGSPCDLADAGMVEMAFAGSATDGVEGAARNCTFEIESGITDSVDVFYFGTDDGWDGVRAGYDSNRGGTTDIEGIGDEAFYPEDAGPSEVVVRAGGHIFAVSVFAFLVEEEDMDTVEMALAQLAGLIADSLG